VGNTADPSQWTAAPALTEFTVRAGAGVNGSTRLTVTWADGAIVGQWLEVTMLSTASSQLPGDVVFYFGNAPGETGNLVGSTRVDTTDQTVARNDPHRNFLNPAGIANVADFNRDGRVDTTDEIIARAHTTTFLTDLVLLSLPLPASAPAAPEPTLAAGLAVEPDPPTVALVAEPAPAMDPTLLPEPQPDAAIALVAPVDSGLAISAATDPLPAEPTPAPAAAQPTPLAARRVYPASGTVRAARIRHATARMSRPAAHAVAGKAIVSRRTIFTAGPPVAEPPADLTLLVDRPIVPPTA
jgi:hypothetical protein